MTNTKNTKRALLVSVMSLFLCFVMLLGTTYAWFTDSVTSANNIIKSGNLDVELEYYDGDSWEKVTETTNVFTDTLWEPGHAEVVYLKMSNLGSLALKYVLSVNVANEIESINVNGETLRLSNHIMYDVIEGVTTPYATRQAALQAALTDMNYSPVSLNAQYFNTTGKLYPADSIPQNEASEKYIAFVVYMPETVGNEANYRLGEVVPKIELGINLFATQQEYESDSFGSSYDQNAQHDSEPKATVIETTVVNKEMTLVDISSGSPSLSGQGTLTLDAAYEFRALDSVETAAYSDYSDWLTDYYVSVDAPIADGLTLAGYYEGFPWIAIPVPAGDYTQAVGLLGMFSSGNVSNWTYADIVAGVNTFMCGVVNTNNANAGKTMTVQLRIMNPENTSEYIVISETTYTFQDKITNSQELSNALNAGQTDLTLTAGEYTIPSAVAGKSVTITGAGDSTVINLSSPANVNGANITFENLKITGVNSNTMNGYGIQGTTGDIVYKNCTFENAITNEYYGNVSYIDCTFIGTYYISTYAVDSATFENCVFDRTDSRAILVYSHGDNPVEVTVKNCTFKAAAKGYTWVPEWTAAIEVDTTNIPTAGTTVTIENCTFDANYNGIVRDKSTAGKENAVITVDGVVVDNTAIKTTGYSGN